MPCMTTPLQYRLNLPKISMLVVFRLLEVTKEFLACASAAVCCFFLVQDQAAQIDRVFGRSFFSLSMPLGERDKAFPDIIWFHGVADIVRSVILIYKQEASFRLVLFYINFCKYGFRFL